MRKQMKVSICVLSHCVTGVRAVYTDENALLPKNISVIVSRVPIAPVKITDEERRKAEYALKHRSCKRITDSIRVEAVQAVSLPLHEQYGLVSADGSLNEEERLAEVLDMSTKLPTR